MEYSKISDWYKEKFTHGEVLLEWMDDDYVITLGIDEWIDYDNIYHDDSSTVWITVDGKRLSIRYSDIDED